MSPSIQEWIRDARVAYRFHAGRVLDVGSMDINGSVRQFFDDATEIIGVDYRPGKEVDVVMDGHDIAQHFDTHSFDTVLCLDMFEHDVKFWLTLEAINEVIKQGGYLIVVQPTFGFPIHKHPKDYWRAGEDAFLEVYFEGYELLEMKEVHTKILNGKGINPVLCAIGRKL